MRRLPSIASAISSIALAVALGGCERGCLSTWLGDHGFQGVGASGPMSGGPGLELSGTDCSGGLARCAAGQVEVAREAHIPHPCKPGACACPWDPTVRCASGCALDGAEIVASPDVAKVQLCRPESVVARPLLATDPPAQGVCAAAGMTCEDAMLRWCDEPGKPVRAAAFCLHGCESRVGLSSDHGAAKDLDGAASILCRRLDAERR